MDLLTFILMLVIAGLAATAHAAITGAWGRAFVGLFVALALVLTLPALLPRLLGG